MGVPAKVLSHKLKSEKMKYYDSVKGQIMYFSESASPDFWDGLWKKQADIKKNFLRKGKYSLIARITRKLLKPNDGVILEGGCGLGTNVGILKSNGYNCIGIDNAKQSIEYLNKNVPQIDVRFGDVRNLKFEENYFSGYWSIGVIEHFWSGYDDIAKNMKKVLKPNGYLFLSFPYMNLFRKFKSMLGLYDEFEGFDKQDFYQFALNKKYVIEDYSKLGFVLVSKYHNGVLFGLQDEIGFMKNPINFVNKYKTKYFITKLAYQLSDYILNMFLGPIFGHMIVLVFKSR